MREPTSTTEDQSVSCSMPTYADVQMPPPNSWEEFEKIVCSAAKNRWRNPGFSLHGRSGQRQDGVDVFGNDDKGRLVGLQCKNTCSGLTLNAIREEVGKAEAFNPPLYHLYVTTTAPSDAALQAAIRALSNERKETGRFGVSIMFWRDVWADLALDEKRLFQHYPQFKPAASVAAKPTHDQRLYARFQAEFGFEPVVRLLREHDFGGPFSRKSVRPLYDFYEKWDQPETEFKDKELQAELVVLFQAAREMSDELVGRTVPVGKGDESGVFPDRQRASGPRPPEVVADALILNELARKFVPIYERFVRVCRMKLED
jgi:hypothetical protein